MMGEAARAGVDVELLEERFELAAPAARRGARGVALLAIHLEPHGRSALTFADELQRAALERLRACLKRVDTVAVIASFDFLVLLERLEDGPFAVRVAERVVSALQRPISIGQRTVKLVTSIGISVYPNDGDRVDELIRCAESAEQAARASGGDLFGFHSGPMSERAGRRIAVERALLQAIEREELELAFQPQLDTRDGTLVGVEGLLRWRDDLLGSVSPSEFVPILEGIGEIDRVGEWVLRRACREAVGWSSAGAPARIGVNVSAHQLRSRAFADMVCRALDETGLEPRLLELELTEGVLVENPASTREVLDALRRAGVRIAVDDFGTGYASLAYVRQFPMDTLKIDRQFVRGLPIDAENAAITSAIVALGHSLRLEIVAEGVETEAEEEFLHSLGCYLVQGFRFAQPMSPSEFVEWRRARPWA